MTGWMFNVLLGLAIVGFVLWQLGVVALYFYRRIAQPDKPRKFPVLSLLIFLFCCGFYAFAFIMDYSN